MAILKNSVSTYSENFEAPNQGNEAKYQVFKHVLALVLYYKHELVVLHAVKLRHQYCISGVDKVMPYRNTEKK